jgi:hypothetical protein
VQPAFFFPVAAAIILAGCAARQPPPSQAAVAMHGCYQPGPDFERFVAQRATRAEVERFMGSDVERIASEKALRSSARGSITPANLALFRRFRSASISFMECDNQVIAFFDNTGHIIAFQAM